MTKTVFPTLSSVETKPIGGGSGIDDKKCIYYCLRKVSNPWSVLTVIWNRGFFSCLFACHLWRRHGMISKQIRVDYTLPVSLCCVKWVHKAFILQLSNWRFLLASSSVVSHVVDRFPLLVFWSRTKMAAKATQN